ncbi:hydantoinase B/oxoprolinase family protein [Roseomonas sp. NAR14]|uniref:Hydantoinase B/oxoprolinase family protein n=1 Tax=Roseomonas acroporae TaxID=2937791 RepID=A0A9X1YE46_9PROT|nr:hydantoinase B/oxoprolinase family protein [Roseomonas acroporae]MCK8787022.1 hydantoinase B/oxoprolinase family protein [Roseomonas acroporae]
MTDPTTPDPVTPDPVTLAVLQARFTAIVEEMGEALLRTAYSQILNASRDFSIALCDAGARLVAQADHLPVHVGAMPYAVRAVLDGVGARPRPGDIFLVNDPWHGGSHLPDMTVVVPVFGEDGTLRFWSVVRAHMSDIGGATHGAYNAAATDIWQEGIRVPPIRLGEDGVVREDLLAMLAANTRLPRDFRGDMLAAVGAARLGGKRLGEAFARHGAARVSAAGEAILALSEERARAILATWREGTWRAEARLDDDGRGNDDVTIRAAVTVGGGRVAVDLSESDPQVASFVNSSYANMRSAVAIAFAYLLDPDIPKNDGVFRLLDVTARQGTVAWAAEGAPVTLCTNHSGQEILEAVLLAMANACPERAMAGWGKRFRIAITGRDPRRGRPFVWHLFHARPGGGASPAGDGWPCAGEWGVVGGIKFGSVEMAEARFPLFFERHEIHPGSGGDGTHRGGPGGLATIRVESEGPSVGNTAGDGARHGVTGMAGGAPGAPHRYVLRAPDGTERVLRTKETGIPIPAGAVLDLRAGGGGGWGPPEGRDPAARRRDAEEGFTA